MIEQKYQGKGYGRETLMKAIKLIKLFPYGFARTLVLSNVSDNEAGSSLYESVEFRAMGEVCDGI